PFPEWLIRRMYVKASRVADTVVGVSNAVGEELGRAGVPGEKIRVIHNGVDPDRFTPAAESLPRLDCGSGSEPRLQGEGVSCLRVGAAGNLRALKGFETLIRAAALAAHGGRNAGAA